MILLNALLSLSDYLERIVKLSVIMSMSCMVFFINLAVYYRYVLSDPLTWTTELSNYLLIYTVLFGSSIAIRQKQFVKVEVFLNVLPSHIRIWVVLISHVLIGFFLVISIGSPSMLIDKAIITNTVSPALSIPMAHLYRLLRLGFVCMLFFLCMNGLDFLRSNKLTSMSKERRL